MNIKKENSQGILWTRTVRNMMCMFMVTNCGNYRGGKTYSVTKRAILFSGQGIYIYVDEHGKIQKKDMTPKIPFKIKAGIAHMFYFPVTSRLFEFFPKNFTSKPHTELQAIKKSSQN